MKKYLSLMIALLLCLSLHTPVKAATIKLNKTSITLKVNKTKTLKVLHTSKKVTWSSSNKKIAKVSSSGKVTAIKPGTTYIKAKVKGKRKVYKCKIKVIAWLSASSKTIYAGQTKRLTLYGTSIKSLKSSQKSIASISQSGKAKATINAKKAGTTTLTIKCKNGKSYQCQVKVKYYSVTVGKVESAKTLLGVDSGIFKTSDQSIALIDRQYGIIVPVSTGVCTIYNGDKKIKIKVKDNTKVKVGVDISKWQGSVDVDKLKKNNLDFVIVRAGHKLTEDVKFDTFIKQLIKEKMPFGIYWYLASHTDGKAMSVKDAKEEAKALVKVLKPYQDNDDFESMLKLPVYLDLEDKTLVTGYTKKSKAEIAAHMQELVEAFTGVLEDNGFTNYSIYASKYYTEAYLNNAYFASFAKKYWHARYGFVGAPTVTINNQTISPNIWQIGYQFDVEGTGSTNTDVDYYYE